MANTSDIRKGLCIRYNNDIYSVIEFLHVKPGKGNAFVRTKLKSITNGKVVDQTFSSGQKIDDVRVERRTFQYLFPDDNSFHFMNNETYEQITIPKDNVDHSQFLKEGMDVEILFDAEDERPLIVELPQYLELEVVEADPGVKGNTATNATKNATLETGAEVKVPLFINPGDVIKIETETGNYVERIKK